MRSNSGAAVPAAPLVTRRLHEQQGGVTNVTSVTNVPPPTEGEMSRCRELFLVAVLLLSPATAAVAQTPDVRSREYQMRIGDTGWDPFRVYPYPREVLERQRGTWDVVAGHEAFELAHVVLALTGFAERTVRDDAYAAEVEAWFGPHRNHPLIRKLSAMDPSNYRAYNAFRLNAYAYCFDGEWVYFRVCHPVSHFYGRVANPFVQNAELLVDFVWESNFREFFERQTPYYERLEADFRALVPLDSMWAWLEARYPTRVDRYEVIFPAAGFGVHYAVSVDFGGFTTGYLFVEHVSNLDADEAFRAHRLVFTELDHTYDSPITRSAEYFGPLGDESAFGAAIWVDSARVNRSYLHGAAVFAEYMTWSVFELWAWENYDDEVLQRARTDVEQIMRQRGFPRYAQFAAELRRLYDMQSSKDLAGLYDDMLEWARAYVEAHRAAG